MCAAAEARGGIVRAGGCSMGRCSALTRRSVVSLHGLVNCGPSRRCVWPVLAPAGGIVRAGAVLRSDAARARGLCSSCAGRAVLLGCLVFVRAHHTFLSGCLMLDHACCLPHSAKQNGLRYVPFLFRRGSGSPFVRSQWPCGYRTWWVHFGLARFFMAIPTELRRDEGTRGTRRTESAARRGRVFAWTYWLCHAFRGEYAGATRPRLRQGDSSPWTLFI